MKILCDVHISFKLVKYLHTKGIDAIHVNEILDKWNTKDKDICKYADEHNYIVVTKDVDFRNSYFLQNTPRKLIRICLGNISNQELINIFEVNREALQKIYFQERFYIEVGQDNVMLIS
jgi:predicted nuclease of predicted toxin-antitoxin system